MSAAADLVQMLDLRQMGDRSYVAENLPGPSPVVFGGQILAQVVASVSLTVPDKQLKSLHTVFARGGAPDRPLEIDLIVLQESRSSASLHVEVRQGDRLCAESIALFHDTEPDLLRHANKPPGVTRASDLPVRPRTHSWWDVRIVDNVDPYDPAAVGSRGLNVWSRFSEIPNKPFASHSLLAFASDGFFFASAMHPHEAGEHPLSDVSISTGIMGQSLNFHESFDAAEWLLLSHQSIDAGLDRSLGRAHVFTEGGRLVASFTQEKYVLRIPKVDGLEQVGGSMGKY
jgi:acyl-CoA thioesterase II